MIHFWDGKKRRIKEKCFEEYPIHSNITQVDDGAGSTRPTTTDEAIARVVELIGDGLKLLCKEGVSATVFTPTSLIRCQEPAEAFTNEYIFELLEFFIFVGQKSTSLGVNHTSRFCGAYTLPAVAFVCTLVSFGIVFGITDGVSPFFARCTMLRRAMPRAPKSRLIFHLISVRLHICGFSGFSQECGTIPFMDHV